jgi:4-alpha-glucanotransferase
MSFERVAGVLLHPTSLPGPDGIGDLGPEAYDWINTLEKAGFHIWQILPLGPTGYGDSPYQSFSAFAGNPYLVSPALLLEDGLLTEKDLADRPDFAADFVDFGNVIPWKIKVLDRAFDAFEKNHPAALAAEFTHFQEVESAWLDDYAIFMSIKETQGGLPWNLWPAELKKHQSAALKKFQAEHLALIQRHKFRQFIFFRQWSALHAYALSKKIQVIGDIPIFIAFDSADAWSHPELFHIDEQGEPVFVAGVPPDYFSSTGQLWGNPLYKWEVHKASGYQWWIDRFKASLKFYDLIRLDHFRGFAGYWQIPANMPTAEVGKWVKGPGADFLSALEKGLGSLPIIAEDLGDITPDVFALRDQFNLPGMKIFQFAFATDPTDPFLPHSYPVNCVAYTGTHDNDTVLGWYKSAPEKERDLCRRYLASSGADISWDMIRAVWRSVARVAIAPMQDFLSLDTDARMNYPGKPSGNWGWRLAPDCIDDHLLARMAEVNFLYDRTLLPRPPQKKATY